MTTPEPGPGYSASMLPLLALLAACQPEDAAPTPTSALVPASPLPAPTPAHGTGALVYVPVYSSIYVGEGNQTFDLTVMLSVRNTDAAAPIQVTRADYHDDGGKLLHRYVASPTALAPLASATTVVRASDTRAGVGGSFLVEWRADTDVSEPVIEAVMVGTANQQGISFVREGVVVRRLGGP